MARLPELLGKGLYTIPETARLVGLHSSRVRRWADGYSFVYSTRYGERRTQSAPVVSQDIPRIRRKRALSFLELVEIRMVSAFLKHGVKLGTIRKAAIRARQKLQTDHPFAYKRFKTDGRGIFLELAEESEEYLSLLELASGQYVLPVILNDYLKQVEFDRCTNMAIQWWPLGKSKPIVIDPGVAFGAPVIAGTRLRVSAILAALRIGESRRAVGDWYGVTRAQVAAAVTFGKGGRAA